MNKLVPLLLILCLLPSPATDQNVSEEYAIPSSMEVMPSGFVGIDDHMELLNPKKNIITPYSLVEDTVGNIWISGTYSDLEGEYSVNADGFISKILPSGRIDFTILFNGSGWDIINEIYLDSHDNIVLGGQTDSMDLPVVGGLPAEDPRGGSNVNNYLAKLSPDGDFLWSTYIGSWGFECCTSVYVDDSDDIYFSAYTIGSNYNVLNGTLGNVTRSGASMAVIGKFSGSGQHLWSSFVEGISAGYELLSVRDGRQDRVLFSGYTSSDDYMEYNNNIVNASGTGFDIGLLELNSTDYSPLWSAKIGGSGFDDAWAAIYYGDSIVVGGTIGAGDVSFVNGFDTSFGGSTDSLLMLINESRMIEYATYIGGNASDSITTVMNLEDDVFMALGRTSSPDFVVTDDSIIQTYNLYLAKMYLNDTGIFQSTIISSPDELILVNYPMRSHNGHYFVTGSSRSANISMGGETLELSYPYDFSGGKTGYLIQYNPRTLDPVLFTNALMVPEPEADYDGDGLTNLQEYNLFFDSGKRVDPLDPDSDGDGLDDGWEMRYGFDPSNMVNTEELDDDDGDGLTNLQEFEFGTSPLSTDTDDDGMPDAFEYRHGLDGTIDDTGMDRDGDLMTNGYEFDHGLVPSNPDDGVLDYDFDEASNQLESQYSTDPRDEDTDDDGILDGYEILHSLDPLKPDDAWRDADGDLIPNAMEAFLGLDADNFREFYFLAGFAALTIAVLIYIRYNGRQRNLKAKEEGYQSYGEKRMVQKRGFSNLEEYEAAKQDGYLAKEPQKIIAQLGYSSVGSFISGIEQRSAEIGQTYTKSRIDELLTSVKQIRTPIQLAAIHELLDKFRDDLSYNLSFLQDVQSSMERLLRIMEVREPSFVDLKASDLVAIRSDLNRQRIKLQGYEKELKRAISAKEAWLKPWLPLLKLIQITVENKAIPIEDIMEVVQTSEEQAVDLIEELLAENPELGTYDPSTRIYEKSKTASMTAYLTKAIESMENMEEVD